jgi:hypothetical protein
MVIDAHGRLIPGNERPIVFRGARTQADPCPSTPRGWGFRYRAQEYDCRKPGVSPWQPQGGGLNQLAVQFVVLTLNFHPGTAPGKPEIRQIPAPVEVEALVFVFPLNAQPVEQNGPPGF